jgi:Spy/CpxP family protein refolding chaperone
VLLAAPLALAQGGGKAPEKRAKVEARMKQLRARVLRNQVGLDDKKAAEVEKILAKNAPERKKIQKDVQTHRRRLRELLDQDSNDQAAYQKAIAGFRAAQKRAQVQRDKEIDELSKVLTPKQQAKLFVALRKLQAQLRKRVRQSQDRD